MSAPSIFDASDATVIDDLAIADLIPVPVDIFVTSPFTWRRPTPADDTLEFTDDRGRHFRLRGDAVSLLANGLDAIKVARERAGVFPDESKFE